METKLPRGYTLKFLYPSGSTITIEHVENWVRDPGTGDMVVYGLDGCSAWVSTGFLMYVMIPDAEPEPEPEPEPVEAAGEIHTSSELLHSDTVNWVLSRVRVGALFNLGEEGIDGFKGLWRIQGSYLNGLVPMVSDDAPGRVVPVPVMALWSWIMHNKLVGFPLDAPFVGAPPVNNAA